MKYFFNNSKWIIATSKQYLSSSKVLSEYSNKVKVIPLCINPNSYPNPNYLRVNEILKNYSNGFFLFVGVLRYYKGLHILLKAIQGTNLTTIIAGEGPEKYKLQKQSKELNLSNVVFTGSVDDQEKVNLIQACKAMVFPSHLRSEAFGISLLEGLMLGKPLISTEIGTGTSHINKHNSTGIVIPPNDVKSLRGAMLKLFYNKKLCEKYENGSKERFERLFSNEKQAEQYINIYNEALMSSR